MSAVAAAPPPPAPAAPGTVGGGTDRDAIERALRDAPTGFAAFQAVRLLGRLRPDRAPVGGWADPAREVVRFTVPPAFGFPPTEVHALAADPAGGPPRLAVNFFGLVGPQGVLPHVYTHHAGARARARDKAARDFLDLFQHRALSLFYRAWARPKAALGAELGDAGHGGGDWLLAHLLDVAGLGTAGLRGGLAVGDAALGYYAGLLADQNRPAEGLARLVGDYFGVPAAVEEFVGEWRRLDGGGQCLLGGDGDAGRLGLGVLGDEAWDAAARVRVRLGPLSRAAFDAFLPGGGAHRALRDLARLYADEQVGVDAQLVLRRDAVAPVTLGERDGAPALGRGMWLVTRPMARDPDEATFALC